VECRQRGDHQHSDYGTGEEHYPAERHELHDLLNPAPDGPTPPSLSQRTSLPCASHTSPRARSTMEERVAQKSSTRSGGDAYAARQPPIG
jgi:hypothetical protein